MIERPGQVGYIQVLKRNKDYRRLFIGQFVSQGGDWFNTVAIYTLLLSLSGSAQSIAYILIIKLLPVFLMAPVAGVAADRFNRKTIMISADILRGILVLGYLFVSRPGQVWVIYLLTGVEVIIGTFFEPAKSASIPNIVSEGELVSANALSGASWSVTLALGAALGGVVTGVFGRNSAFIIDSASFFVSASFIWFVRIPPLAVVRAREYMRTRAETLANAFGFTDIVEGLRYLRTNLDVVVLLLVKTGWGMGGGVLLLLTIFGKKVFPLGNDGSVSIGLLYAARGIGAAIGPLLARPIAGDSSMSMKRAIGVAFFVTAIFYLLLAQASGLAAALLFVVGAHAGGSVQWTFSTSLLQLTVPDRFRGRVFALDMALLTLTMSVSTYLTGWGLDRAGLSERALAAILGMIFVVPGLAWILYLALSGRRKAAVHVMEPIAQAAVIESPPSPETSFPPT
jgi:predicted MFS family arabinose efflux permease